MNHNPAGATIAKADGGVYITIYRWVGVATKGWITTLHAKIVFGLSTAPEKGGWRRCAKGLMGALKSAVASSIGSRYFLSYLSAHINALLFLFPRADLRVCPFAI